MSLVMFLNSDDYRSALPILIDRGHLFDANFGIDAGWSPLDLCISQSVRLGTEILVLFGANLDIKNRFGHVPAEFALENNFINDEHTYKVLSGEIKPRSLPEIIHDEWQSIQPVKKIENSFNLL